MITSEGWLDWADRKPGPVEKKYSTPCTSEFYIPHSMVGRLPGWYTRLFDMTRLSNGRFTPNAAASVTGSILLDGKVIQHFPFKASCWASGNFEANTRGNAFENESQYTLDRFGVNRPDESKPFTDKQVESNLHIIRDMSQHFGWIPKRPGIPIVGPETPIPEVTLLEHNEVVRLFGGGVTACPSDRTRTLWAMIPEIFKEEDMAVYLLKQEGTQYTFISDGFNKRYVNDNAALVELQAKGIWPTKVLDVSKKALDQLVG